MKNLYLQRIDRFPWHDILYTSNFLPLGKQGLERKFTGQLLKKKRETV